MQFRFKPITASLLAALSAGAFAQSSNAPITTMSCCRAAPPPPATARAQSYWNLHPYPQRSYTAELKFDM